MGVGGGAPALAGVLQVGEGLEVLAALQGVHSRLPLHHLLAQQEPGMP